ncbi:hypothetical protein jhhlp_005774 [Lomentospora prolificans]|uniref:Vacuolar protein sorting-associated protein 51 homolog n=1 Tax=Lomentospora prolificans TaxID=41688 RepID=A0A2N3N432_9PEZI|nr:hypothetical protein jhhlp_005774 [Lomentospora prolificans]
MSTIASPRDPSTPLRRTPSGVNSPTTGSARPSIDSLHPPLASPQPPHSPQTAQASVSSSKRNRTALREYYNLRRTAGTPSAVVNEDSRLSEVPPSELDAEGFEPQAWVDKKLAECGLEELLRLYTGILGEIRALDAEKKALVYDNYSKLITATETIRKMRDNMDPLTPMASDLDPKIAQIYSQASQIRDALRNSVPKPAEGADLDEESIRRRQRTQQLAAEVVAMPPKLRALVEEGRLEDARKAWEMPRRLLEVWREKKLGGADVMTVLEEGDAIVEWTDDDASSSAASSQGSS